MGYSGACIIKPFTTILIMTFLIMTLLIMTFLIMTLLLMTLLKMFNTCGIAYNWLYLWLSLLTNDSTCKSK